MWGCRYVAALARSRWGLARANGGRVGNAVRGRQRLTVMHRLIPDHRLGRAFGAFWGSAMAGVAVGSIAAAPLIDGVGLLAAMGGAGVVMALVPWLLWPRLRQVDTDVAVDADRIALLRSLPLFAPLSRFSLEHIARRAVAVAVDPGGVVVRQGDPGDLFYVVVLASCRADGRRRAHPLAAAPASARSPCCPHLPHRHRGAISPASCSDRAETFIAAVTSNPGAKAPPGPSPKRGSPKRTARSLSRRYLRSGEQKPTAMRSRPPLRRSRAGRSARCTP